VRSSGSSTRCEQERRPCYCPSIDAFLRPRGKPALGGPDVVAEAAPLLARGITAISVSRKPRSRP
jgi:hypothetical protein